MMHDCKKYFDRISEYLDGELDENICKQIEAHLSDCPECRNCINSLRKTIQLCKEGAQEEMPADIHERLKSALRDCFNQEYP